MIQTKMNKTISSVLALMFLFAIVEKNIGSATTRNSNAMTSSSENEATAMTPTTTTCVDPTFLFNRTKKKNSRTKTMDLCAWVSSARSKKNNNKEKKKRRCSKRKAGVMVKDRCHCACAEFAMEEEAVSACPAAGPIFTLLEGKSCANINIGVTCQYDDYETRCEQVTSNETCQCKSNNDKSGGGVDNNNNASWECESLHLEPCPETPTPVVAPTQQPRRPRPPPSTAAAAAAINMNAHPTSSFFDASTFAGACMVVMLAFVVVLVKRRGENPREGYINIVTDQPSLV